MDVSNVFFLELEHIHTTDRRGQFGKFERYVSIFGWLSSVKCEYLPILK